jgi:hypothetical protein
VGARRGRTVTPPPLTDLVGRAVSAVWHEPDSWGFALGDAVVVITYPAELSPATLTPFRLAGLRLESLDEDAASIVLGFEAGALVRVTKSPDRDCGPEAMSISFAGGPIVVW